MAQWYVKELSKLTQISVQTLHHYDRIGLLKPSVRLPNGYRLYSEKDLLKLQQIIALKFFGFELSQIKILLNKEIDLIDHLSAQSQHLYEQAKNLFEASQTLKNIISTCSRDTSIPWNTIIKSIEVYRMIQQLEKSWVGKVFNSEELKQYAEFEQQIKNRFTDSELKNIHKQWDDIIGEVSKNLKSDPESKFGMTIGKRTMDWVNHYYGKEHGSIRNAIWVKGFKEGQVDPEHALSPEVFAWLEKAITAYYSARIENIFKQLDTQPHQSILNLWENLLIDMYGEDYEARNRIFNRILTDDKFNQAAKNWVKKYMAENPQK